LELGAVLTTDASADLGLTTDISEGGIFVATLRRCAVGQPVELELALPTGSLRVAGTVRWVRDTVHICPGLGIAFRELSNETREALRKCCTEDDETRSRASDNGGPRSKP
jgi:uncharacterized protein (TIGR02266 family)